MDEDVECAIVVIEGRGRGGREQPLLPDVDFSLEDNDNANGIQGEGACVVSLLTEFTTAADATGRRGGRDDDNEVVEEEVKAGKREECCGGEVVALLGLLGTG